MVCYTFAVRDLHPLLLAGLPAHPIKIDKRGNVGRPAGASHREQAKHLARLVREALNSPDGTACVNPEDPWEEHTYAGVDHLLGFLDHFAQTGRFCDRDGHMAEWLIRYRAAGLLKAGTRKVDVVELLAEQNHRSPKHIERIITGIKKPRPHET
jgi:hypothetical protein